AASSSSIPTGTACPCPRPTTSWWPRTAWSRPTTATPAATSPRSSSRPATTCWPRAPTWPATDRAARGPTRARPGSGGPADAVVRGSERGELLLEPPAGAEQPGHDRADGHVQGPGDVAVADAAEIRHLHHGAEVFAQGVQGA